MRNTAKNHWKLFGSYEGWEAGYDIEDPILSTELCEELKKSRKQELHVGDIVRIRGVDMLFVITNITGMFIWLAREPLITINESFEIEHYSYLTAREFREIPYRKKGKYIYGRIHIYIAHVVLYQSPY